MLSGDRSTTRGKERRTSMVIATLHSDIFKVMWITRIPSHRMPTLARLVFPRFNGHWDCWERSTGNLKGGFIDKYRDETISRNAPACRFKLRMNRKSGTRLLRFQKQPKQLELGSSSQAKPRGLLLGACYGSRRSITIRRSINRSAKNGDRWLR